MVKKSARKGKQEVSTTKATKEKKPAPSPYAKTTIWVARDAYNDVCGVLVSEPGNLNAPIAFLFEQQEKSMVAEIHQYAADIFENPDLLDRAVDYAIEHPICRMDLRDRGRESSTRRMPGWCYSLRLTPESEDGFFDSTDAIDWNPFCPIRLVQMMVNVKKIAARA